MEQHDTRERSTHSSRLNQTLLSNWAWPRRASAEVTIGRSAIVGASAAVTDST